MRKAGWLVAWLGLGAALAAAAGGAPAAETQGRVLVLDYADFGPPAIASGLLGPEWYQWESEGGPDPAAKFHVRVAVYRGISSKEVRRLHPVDRARLIDFRYARYDRAIAWLDSRLAELRKERTADPALFDSLIERLEATRARIWSALPPPGAERSVPDKSH
jgi:hypothetical protein